MAMGWGIWPRFSKARKLKSCVSGSLRAQKGRKLLLRPKEMDEAQMEGPVLSAAGGAVRNNGDRQMVGGIHVGGRVSPFFS